MTTLLLVAAICGILYGLLAVLSTRLRAAAGLRAVRAVAARSSWPSAVILMPAKGLNARSMRVAELLGTQDYPDYRLILVIETASDPAAVLAAHQALAGKVQLVVSGSSRINSQKAHSLRAALNHCQAADDIVVFADADMEPPRDWLKRLIAPLAASEADVVTGYRISFPAASHFSSSALAACDLALATASRVGSRVLCWGGSTALHRATLARLNYGAALATTLSTDVPLSRLIWRAGLRVVAPASLVLPNEAAAGWGRVFSFARRQYQAIFTHSGGVGWMATALALPVVGWYGGLVALLAGQPQAAALLLILWLCDGRKALLRHRFVARVAGQEIAWRLRGSLFMTAFMGWFLAPLHLAFALSALVGQTTTWAGIRYRIRGPNQVERLTDPGV